MHLSVVKVSVVFYNSSVFCYLGGEKCQLCSGSCCTLVNSVISALVEEGELDPNAEVW